MNDTVSPKTGKSWISKIISFIKREPRDLPDIIEYLRIAETQNLLNPDVLIMIERTLHVSHMQVRDAMIPKAHMTFVSSNSDPIDIINTVVESGHSRFPIISEDTNEILGILLAKDLLAYSVSRDDQRFDMKDMMHSAVFIPESKRLNILLREFRINRNHMAIVVDEYGVTGLITIEDVIEEIVGEIEDEHDVDEEENILLYGRARYTVKAATPIEEFNRYFNTSLTNEDYDTIGGLIINAFGYLPKRGESIDYANFNVKVLKSDKRRIHLLRFEKLAEADEKQS